MSAPARWAWAEINDRAIERNVRVLIDRVAPSALWAVVKADGYGHGAVTAARAALRGGAEGLCVALVQEGVELRRAGIDAPILLLSEQPPEQAATLVEHRLTPTVYSVRGVDALVDAGPDGLPVHVKIDTGMQRVGAHVDDATSIIEAVAAASPQLRLAGVFTHLAIADDDADPALRFTADQLDRFDLVLATLGGVGDVAIHAANSAGGLAHAAARRSLVRAGIAIYGISPGEGVDDLVAELRPAMSLRARVSFVKRVRAGTAISYGLRHTFERDTNVATVPIGYADGVPRRLGLTGGEVLIGGRRRPMVGVVTMDQLMVDIGADDIEIGDEVVLIGEQGDERIRAEDWAARLDTIGYEVVCGVSARVPRVPRRSIDG